MKRALTILSIVANVILMGVLFSKWKPVEEPVHPASATHQIPSPTTPAKTVISQESAETISSDTFDWSQLESADYPTYMANLRAVRCPEQTVFNIIFADIEKLYDEKKKQLSKKPQKFWRTRDESRQLELEQAEYLLKKEKRQLIKTLLNSDLDWETVNEWYRSSQMGMLLGFLPDQKAEEVASIGKGFVDDFIFGNATNSGLRLPGDVEGNQKTFGEATRAVANVLVGEQLEEITLRIAAEIQFSRGGSNNLLKVSGVESRQLAALKWQFDNPFSQELRKYSGSDVWQDKADHSQYLDAVKKFLGVNRYVQFLSDFESTFRGLDKFSKTHKLPNQSILGLFDMAKATEIEKTRITENPLLTGRERKRAQDDVNESSENAVRTLLGRQLGDQYLKHPLNESESEP